MVLHVHKELTDKLNILDVANELVTNYTADRGKIVSHNSCK